MPDATFSFRSHNAYPAHCLFVALPMKTLTLYHNPRCSKSREALAIVEKFSAAHDVQTAIIDYQKTPLSLPQLKDLQCRLGVPVVNMMRAGDDAFMALKLDGADEEALLQAIVANPALLQRPIAVYDGRGVVGRPPERIAALLAS
jgi:arsenate reductase (glutaredoxin)